MAIKKKIQSFNNWKSTVLWIATVMPILIILFLAIEQKSIMPLKSIHIDIVSQEGQKSILNEEMVLNKLETYLGYTIDQANIDDLNLVELEQLMKSDDRIKSAEIFIDGAERIHVEILQRNPILRVFSDNGENFYLDEDGQRINSVKGLAARVPIVTGKVSSYNDLFMTEEYTGSLKEAYQLALQLREDVFLSALIEQIYIDELSEMVLIPKLGEEQLAFGTIADSKEKLENIKEFYEHGLPSSGWSKYHTLTFKYKGALFAEK